MGKLYDDKGNLMSPSYSSKNGVRYRFYVSSALLRGRKAAAGAVGRIPAAGIEAAVLAALQSHQEQVQFDNELDPIVAVRIRAGVAMNNWLFYATGGAAFVKESANGTSIAGVACGTLGVFPNCSVSSWRPGIAAGLGVEWGFAQNWSAKLEYLYIDAVGSGVSNDHIDTVRGGINYRF
jgi:hypothetical protein